ncbi:MAG: hypothetical protein D6806_16135 [Deltaproteobacteria bacterium]|nr:MAG: hypothetical protein D6806_16135 [Deltaproteobacteria bacterium]
MADEKEKKESGEEEELVVPKRSPVVPLLLAVNMVAVLGVGAYFLFFKKDTPAKAETAQKNQPAQPAQPAPAPVPVQSADLGNLPPLQPGGNGPLMTLENFIVNLADEEVNRYLKVGMTFELSSEEASEIVKKKEPVIRDAIITLTSSLTFSDIRTAKGKRTLRQNVVRVVNTVLGAPLVRAVFFNEFVVQ